MTRLIRIVLLQDVPQLGRQYEVKEVAPGFARHYLLPKGLAAVADPGNLAQVAAQKQKKAREEAVRQAAIQKSLTAVAGLTLVVKAKANERGQLFAAIRPEEISRELKEQKGIELAPGLIELPAPPKRIGEYPVKAKFAETAVEFTIKTEPA